MSAALTELEACARLLVSVPRGNVEPASLYFSVDPGSDLGHLVDPRAISPADVAYQVSRQLIRRGRTRLCTLEAADLHRGDDKEALAISLTALAQHVEATATFKVHPDDPRSMTLDCDVCVLDALTTISVVVPEDAPAGSHVVLHSVRIAGCLLRDVADARFLVITGLQTPLTLRSDAFPSGVVTPAVTLRG